MSNMKPVLGSQIQLGHPLCTGLVACWLFNEGSGDYVQDSFSNAHGTPIIGGSSTWAAGKFGIARSFNGSDQNIRFLDGGPTDISGANAQITILAWVKLPLVDPAGYICSKYLPTTGNRQYQLYYNQTEHEIRFNLSPNGTAYTAVTGLSHIIEDGNFHQVVATSDDNYMRLYIDSKLDCTPAVYTTGIFSCPHDFRIGSNPAGSWFNGMIDHIMIWDRALTANEIQSLYINPFQMFEEDME